MRPDCRPLVHALLLAGCLAAGACNRGGEEAPRSGPIGVAVQPARIDTLRDAVSAPGLIVPAAAGDWTITIGEPADIVELPKREGDTVAVGDLLVRLEIASLTQETAASELAVLEASSDVERAKAAAAQTQGLFDKGMIARVQHEQRQADLAAAESRLRQATSRFEATKADEARTVIRARFPGSVVSVWHAPGDTIAGGPADPILRVVDRSRVQVAVQLPIAQVARVAQGQLATVRSFGSDAVELATVASKAESADPNVATAEVRLAFAQPATLALDTPVSVEIVLDQRADVLVVPTSAILVDGRGEYVVIVADDTRAYRRDIRVGLRTRDLSHVVTGLSPGDRVIVAGAAELSEGAPVTIAR